MSAIELDIKKVSINRGFQTLFDNEAFEKLNKNPFWIAKNFAFQNKKPVQQKIKRFIDFMASLSGLVVLSPLFLLVAILIKIDSKGPVFFKQERLGQFGNKFYMYKFRSMEQNAEEKLIMLKNQNETNEGMFKMYDDPRITRVGKFIRKYSIDELPQLFNVLIGEMSLVGFRPPLERELKSYKTWHYIRFASLPGLTGIWQTSGRSKITNFDLVIEMDYKYANNWNLLLDFQLLYKTIPVVLTGENAA
ncbi:MAG: sugar transferase [Candidatus Gastranaerophilales bacterium]|nr:sugar transferase [Candidatus Gastranaerophilales bacterium]